MTDGKKINMVNQELVRRMAKFLTGHKGTESLNRFAKQLVIGAVRDKGFEDRQNENLKDVYECPWVRLGHFNVLTRFAFMQAGGLFVWDFGGGVSEGQKLGGFASSRGRVSQWVGDTAKKVWEEHNVKGVVLVGLNDDVSFFYVSRDEFLALDSDRLSYKVDSETLQIWKKAWGDLVFQQTFGSLMGGGE
jgi:hypothetical protein